MEMDEFKGRLAVFCARVLGAQGELSDVARLSGGANMESWAVDYGPHKLVLRRAPSADMMAARGFGHDVEAELVRTARATGVLAPEIVGELAANDGLGTGYLMRRVEAEVSPVKILANPPASLITDIGRELAKIQAISPRDTLAIPCLDATTGLAELKARFIEYGGDRPVLALAIAWLEAHIPTPVPPVLVHGDFRMGNLMVDRNGLAAVLDWELAHWGDAHEDLAWGCITAWQFGHIDLPAFGCATLADYFAAYEAAGGTKIDPARFRFWLIYRTLWWGLCCLEMGEIWRSGRDRNLERAVIGRRTSETEVDLLLLLEEDAPTKERGRVAIAAKSPAQPIGEPTAPELLTAVREWLAAEVKPKAEGRDRFLAAVAINALGILGRELTNPLQPTDCGLAQAIIAGKQSLATPGLLAHLKRQSLTKIANDNPKYAALAKATALWCE